MLNQSMMNYIRRLERTIAQQKHIIQQLHKEKEQIAEEAWERANDYYLQIEKRRIELWKTMNQK